MLDIDDITLLADTAFTIPDDVTDVNTIPPYENSALSFDATELTVEFDYGLGFNESFSQTQGNQEYNSAGVKAIRLTSVGAPANARATFFKPIGGL